MADLAPLNVLVLAGGISHERDVSLHSGRRVADALQQRGHRVTFREPDSSLLAFLADYQPDVVWPALHGASGEDGALRALLDISGVPYVGADPGAARLAWRKPIAKTLVSRAGLATPESITLPRETFRELGAESVLATLRENMGLPLVVKPSQGGSAQGVSIITDDAELPHAMVNAFSYDEVALVERQVQGTEVAVAVVGTYEANETAAAEGVNENGGVSDKTGDLIALPAVEIVPTGGVYSFEARYNAGETHFFTPARVGDDVASAVAQAALTVHRTLGLRHLSRIDMIVDPSGTPWFLEANVLPGFTETSLFPLAVQAAGFALPEICERLAILALESAN